MQRAVASLFILHHEDHYFFNLNRPAQSVESNLLEIDPVGFSGSVHLAGDLRKELQQSIDSVINILNTFEATEYQRVIRSSNDSEDKIKRLGLLLFQRLLPETIKQVIQDLDEKTPLILSTNDPLIPWELLHDGSEFLVLRRPVTRQLLSDKQLAIGKPLQDKKIRRCLFLCNPTGDLPDSSAESEALIELFDTAKEEVHTKFLNLRQVTRLAVLGELTSGQYDLIHYSGHATPSALQLHDGLLHATEIQQSIQGNPIIFLNACESMKSTSEGEVSSHLLPTVEVEDLASALIQGGAKAVIGTLWKVLDAGSRQFSESFYENLLEGASLGESALNSRNQAYSQSSLRPIWASYVVYGDPNIRLFGMNAQESRQVTIIDAKFSGLFEISNSMPLEKYVQLKENFEKRITAVSKRFGGNVSNTLSNLTEIQFGIPTRKEDDAIRALKASFELINTVREYNEQNQDLIREVQIQIGVATGQVLSKRPYVQSEHTWEIQGLVTDQAQFLCQLADDGSVLIDTETMNLSKNHFEFNEIEQNIDNQGFPYSIFQVTPKEQFNYKSIELVGRNNQVDNLLQDWDEAKQNRGRYIEIIGAAGIGKSRLLREFQSKVENDPHFRLDAACQSYTESTSFALVAQIVQQLASIKSEDTASDQQAKLDNLVQSIIRGVGDKAEKQQQEGVALLNYILNNPINFPEVETLQPELKNRRLVGLLQALLQEKSKPAPIVLILEDLHWIDEASWSLLKQILNRINRLSILILATYRPEWSHSSFAWEHYRQIRLSALTQEAQREFIKLLLGEEKISNEFNQMIWEQAAGNPFFIEEFIQSLKERKYIIFTSDGWELTRPISEIELPSRVENIVQARFEQLPDESKNVIRQASVIGRKFERTLLENISSDSEKEVLDSHLDQLEIKNLIENIGGFYPDIDYSFRHGIIQQSIYIGLMDALKRRLHQIIVRGLLRFSDSNDLTVVQKIAHHAYLGMDRNFGVKYCMQAAERSLETWSNNDALRWYSRAQELLDLFNQSPPTHREIQQGITPEQVLRWSFEILDGTATIQWKIGQHQEAQENYLKALELAKSNNHFSIYDQAYICYQFVHVAEALGGFELAQDWISRGLETLDGVENKLAAQIYVWGGLLDYRQGNPSKAFERCKKGTAIAEAVEDKRTEAMGINLLGLIYRNQGDKEEALAAHLKSKALYEADSYVPGTERAISNLACVYQDMEDWAQAIHYFEESKELSEKTGEVFRLAGAFVNLGEVARLQSQYAQAEEWYSKGRELAIENQMKEIEGIVTMNLGAVKVSKKDYVSADLLSTEALAIFQEINSRQYFSETNRYLAMSAYEQAKYKESKSFAQESKKWAEKLNRKNDLEKILELLQKIDEKLDER